MKRVNLMIILATLLAIFSGYAFADTTRELVQNDRMYALYDLSAIPLDLRAYGNIYFVSSISANASDDGAHGNSWFTPFATIDYANGKCVAPSAANKSTGDLILVSPGHVEDPATGVTIDFDVAGVTLWCLGGDNDRARIDYSFANNSVDIGANNVRIHGLTLRSSVTDVLIGIDVETTVTGTILEDIRFLAGEATADEFIVQIDLKGTNTDTIIRRCDFREYAASAGQTTGIILSAACTNVTIEDCVATGNYSTAFIDDGAACVDLHILRNTMKVADGEPGIELTAATTGFINGNVIESTGLAVDSMIVAAGCSWTNNWGVTADGASATLIGSGGLFTADLATAQLNHLMQTTTTVAADADLTTYIADGTALAHIMSATANTSTFAASTDSLEAISVAVAANAVEIAEADANNLAILADTAAIQQSAPYAVTKALATVASGLNNLFTVSGGPVKVLELVAYVTAEIEGKSCLINYSFDPTNPATDTVFATTGTALEINADAIGTLYTWDGVVANNLIATTNGVALGLPTESGIILPTGSLELAAVVSTSATGTITFYLRYLPLAPGATVVAQ